MVREAAGAKKQRDQLRTAMGDQGYTPEQIAIEMGRRFSFRPRQAWRHTHGWTQEQAAAAYNRLLDHDQAPMTGKRISDFETWPHGGVKPTPTTLAMLAIIYGTTPAALIDLDDREALSPQELITLNIHTPPCSPRPSGSPPNNNTTLISTVGEHAAPPELDTATGQSERESQSTTHRLTTQTTPAPRRHHWRLVVAWLMAITTALGGAVMMTRASVTGSHPRMPLHPLGPSATGSAVPTAPHAPAQQHAIPTAPPPPLPPPVQRIPTPAVSRPAPMTPHPPPPAIGSPPVPLSSQPATADSASAATGIVWKNVYSGLCLDDREDTTTDDRGVLGLKGCDNSVNQGWKEHPIAVNLPFVALNLISSRSGRCITYQPGSVSVWLAPCGDDNQTWVGAWNGLAYYFQPAAIPGACLSATSLAEGSAGIGLRSCAPSSPLTDWRAQRAPQKPTS